MSTIPSNECTIADLFAWYKLQDELKKLRSQESLLRTKLFKHHFQEPKEGTNSLELDPLLVAAGLPPDGMVLKGIHVINRSVDDAALNVLMPELEARKIPVGKLIKRTPELVKSEYNELTKDEKKFFDQVLVIKPGMPSLEVVQPAKRKAKA